MIHKLLSKYDSNLVWNFSGRWISGYKNYIESSLNDLLYFRLQCVSSSTNKSNEILSSLIICPINALHSNPSVFCFNVRRTFQLHSRPWFYVNILKYNNEKTFLRAHSLLQNKLFNCMWLRNAKMYILSRIVLTFVSYCIILQAWLPSKKVSFLDYFYTQRNI